MSISPSNKTIRNEWEFAQTRLSEAEAAVETAKREWKAAKRTRREAKEAARRAKKRLRRAKEEFELAHCGVAKAQKIHVRQVATVAETKIKPRAIRRAKKKTKKFSEAPVAAATESVTDFPAQTSTDSETDSVEKIAEPSIVS